NTYIVMVTRNVLVDRDIVPLLIHSPARYIGMLGSDRRWAETKRLLLEDGLNVEDFTHIHAPIGLEIEAETPEEIAVSIMAQIIKLRRTP
ncbi:MAG: XdhC family protein, partial [Anaerolineales bacterium]|nr:XdhC family protein [Anaerolineales bacterium]